MTTGSVLRLRKSELFRHLGYAPHPGQVEVHRSRAPRRVLACGARWGKSTGAAMEALAALLQPCEASTGWVVAPNYGLTERIFRRVETIVKDKLPHRIEEISARERRIVLRNLAGGHSELVGKSADNPASLLGEGLDWLIVDEAARLRRDIWDHYLSQRLVDHEGWALLVSTPRGMDWFYKLYRRGQGRDSQYQSWCSPSWENPHLDADAIERERTRLTAEAFAQEYGAEFVGVQLEPCDVCGGPSPLAPGVVVVDEDEEPERCADCGLELGDDGKTAVAIRRNGELDITVVSLVSGTFPDHPANILEAEEDSAELTS